MNFGIRETINVARGKVLTKLSSVNVNSEFSLIKNRKGELTREILGDYYGKKFLIEIIVSEQFRSQGGEKTIRFYFHNNLSLYEKSLDHYNNMGYPVVVLGYDFINENIFVFEPKLVWDRTSILIKYSPREKNVTHIMNSYQDFILSSALIERIIYRKRGTI